MTRNEYYTIELIETNPFVKIKVEDLFVTSNLIGKYNFTNCCAAILMGKYFNIPLIDIKIALEQYVPTNNRSQIIEKNGKQIILDAYNANPTSMEVALENFSILRSERKFAFLGDMFELGKTAADEHQKIADLASRLDFEKVFLIGENFNKTDTSLKKFVAFKDVSSFLKGNTLPSNCSIIIKGSRGMALERLVDLL